MEISLYTGPKEPIPHEKALTEKVSSLPNLAGTVVVLNHAREEEFEFLKIVHTDWI